MTSFTAPPITFLAFENPLVVNDGYSSRVNGLFRQLAHAYPIHLVTLTRKPFTPDEQTQLEQIALRVTRIPRADRSSREKLLVGMRAVARRLPYHAALVEYSLTRHPSSIAALPGINDRVYANLLWWTLPLRIQRGAHWILDQHNADVHFWQGYEQHSREPAVRLAARINRSLTADYCQQIYPHVGMIISVCEEDRDLTRAIYAGTPIEVVENGVDCDYFVPAPKTCDQRTILFTGTSAERNMQALRYFLREVYPLVLTQIPNLRFVIGGNFSLQAQRELRHVQGIEFTGPVPDMRPVFQQARIFVNPFQQAYGSKLKVSEALAMGMCIVSFAEGVRGMPVVDRESVLLAHTNTEMAAILIEALHNPALVERIAYNARIVAETALDWRRVLGPRLRTITAGVWQEEGS